MTAKGNYRYIAVGRKNGVTTVTLDRPDQLNAVHRDMHFELDDAFNVFAADDAQRVAVVRGAGRAFCAGSDLRADPRVMVSRTEAALKYPPNGYTGLSQRVDLMKPVIAAVHGAALGGGFEIALACDLIIATENASFGLPEPAVGAVAIGGGVHRLARQIGFKKAMGMILGGQAVSAAEGERLGFVTEVVAAADLDTAIDRWTGILLGHSQFALMASKEAVMRGLDIAALQDAIERQEDQPAFSRLLASRDVIEGPLAFTEKRAPAWQLA